MAGRPTDRPAKEELEQLYLTQGLTVNALVAHYSATKDRVKEWLRHYGISKFPQRRPKTAIKPTDEEIRVLWSAHGSIHAVANQLNVSRTAVRRWLVRAGIEPDRKPGSRPTGERKVKPTTEQQFVVKERRAPTPPQKREEFIPVKQGRNYDELRGKGLTLPEEQQQKIKRLLYLYRLQLRRYQRGLLP